MAFSREQKSRALDSASTLTMMIGTSGGMEIGDVLHSSRLGIEVAAAGLALANVATLLDPKASRTDKRWAAFGIAGSVLLSGIGTIGSLHNQEWASFMPIGAMVLPMSTWVGYQFQKARR